MERFEKVALVRKNSAYPQRGALIASGDSLTFESKKGTLPMSKVRSLAYEGGRLTVEFGEGDSYQTVQFVDMSKSGLRSRSATRELEQKLRGVLSLTPVSEEERAGYERSLAVRKVASGKQGRVQMLIGGGLAIIGIIVTAVTYSGASSSPTGGTYLVLWGPIVFGLILFFQGLAASRASRR